jgi:effector-binding domain-containing protein
MSDRDPVDEVLRTRTGVEIPADVEARMRRQFVEFRARLDREPGPVRHRVISFAGLQPVRWAAAGAALVMVLAVVFLWGGADGGRVYAAAVSRLATARSVQYTIEIAPFVSVEISHLAPAHERIKTSWGLEVRADGSGTELLLLHGSREYVREQKSQGGLVGTADLIAQLRSLPAAADRTLGERSMDGKVLIGYRVQGSRLSGGDGVESLDLWLDARSGALEQVDVTPTGAGASGYQMHIRSIRVDAGLDPALFDMTPPAEYSAVDSARAARQADGESRTGLAVLQPHVTQAGPLQAVVIRMSGSYLQASAAADRVARHLREQGLVPAGPAFGLFESESHWAVGYPVSTGASTERPFEVVTLPGGPVASVVVNGPWGRDSAERWSQMFSWLGRNGYIPVGPPTEAWTGDGTRPDSQATEMRIAVARGRQ